MTENAGNDWRGKVDFPGVPDMSYVDGIQASHHDTGTVYVAFNNHKSGDFKPYILKSTDRGKSWTKISEGLPDKGSVYSILEDPEDPELLFAGTEYGIFFTKDGGKHWIQLKKGVPTINVRDMEIQEREDDLVLGTFGRGFYVLDDITPLRAIKKSILSEDGHLFSISDAYLYHERDPYGYSGKGFQGASFFAAKNPPLGPTFTYHLKETLRSPKEERRKKEKKLRDKGKDVPYPSLEELRNEKRSSKPFLIFTIRDSKGKVVRRLKRKGRKGIHRVHWDMRRPARSPVKLNRKEAAVPWASKPRGYLVLPGTYRVTLKKYEDGKIEKLAGPKEFRLERLHHPRLSLEERKRLKAFEEKVAELRRAVDGANRYKGSLEKRVKHLKKAVRKTPQAKLSLRDTLDAIEHALADIQIRLNGDPVKAKYRFEEKPSVAHRVHNILRNLWRSSSGPTKTQKDSYRIAGKAFKRILKKMRRQRDRIKAVEDKMEEAGAPWTPGRFPHWEGP
ncbi:MAG: WD40/YVTN/BNR-like repeat-containing protein [Flavobacteriales bacterium]